MSNDAISRRHFIKAAGATTGSVAIHAMTSTPATGSVLGANERIQFAVIGCGGMGTGLPTRIYGKYGTLDLDDLTLRANGDMADEFKAANDGKMETKLVRADRRDMEGNFIDVVRSGRTGDLNCNVELGASTMIAIKMGVEAYRQRKTMVWNAPKEKMEHA